MRKTILPVLMAIFICPFINGQSPDDSLFTISYRPSFHNPSQLTVYKVKDTIKGLFQTFSAPNGKVEIDSANFNLPNEIYDSYFNFFSTYKFPGYIDNKFPDTTKNYTQGVDGITIVGIYYGVNKLFRFWSPYGDRESMRLFKMTLNDLDRFFKTRENRKYLKWLRMYSK